jgi:hypothetical protein
LLCRSPDDGVPAFCGPPPQRSSPSRLVAVAESELHRRPRDLRRHRRDAPRPHRHAGPPPAVLDAAPPADPRLIPLTTPRSEGCSPTRPGGPNRPATAARMHSVLSGPPVDSVSVLSQARPADPIEGLTPSVDRCPVRDRARAGCPRASDEPAGGTAACPSRSRRRSVICSGAMTIPADLAAGACQGAVRRGVVRLRAGPRLIRARRSPLSGPWG